MTNQRVTSKPGTPRKHYSEAFKRKIVAQCEGGLLNKDRLASRYGIKGKSTLLDWCRKYGKLPHSSATHPQMGRPLKDPQKQRIKELERALADALLQVKAYEQLIRTSEDEQGISILKKTGTKSSPA